jgi:hypothetical protein
MSRTSKSLARQLAGRPLLNAEAYVSEPTGRILRDGPQHVVFQVGHEAVVAPAEYLKIEGTGAALVAAMRASPHKDIDLEPLSERSPVRDVEL